MQPFVIFANEKKLDDICRTSSIILDAHATSRIATKVAKTLKSCGVSFRSPSSAYFMLASAKSCVGFLSMLVPDCQDEKFEITVQHKQYIHCTQYFMPPEAP